MTKVDEEDCLLISLATLHSPSTYSAKAVQFDQAKPVLLTRPNWFRLTTRNRNILSLETMLRLILARVIKIDNVNSSPAKRVVNLPRPEAVSLVGQSTGNEEEDLLSVNRWNIMFLYCSFSVPINDSARSLKAIKELTQ